MDEKTKMTDQGMKKELSYDDKVIKKIAGIATDGVQGVLTVSGGLIGNITDRLRSDDKTKGIDANVGKKQVALDLNVVCEYGRHVPQLFDEVAEKVGRAIREMTGLELVELNMHVEDVLNKADFEDLRQKTQGDADRDGKQDYIPQNAQPAQTTRVQ
ncbi:MAG: Asp23/Gls24 family envelope stress response protein [Oscillospiraceae bacterium]